MFGGERHGELTVLRWYRDDALEGDVDVQEHELIRRHVQAARHRHPVEHVQPFGVAAQYL